MSVLCCLLTGSRGLLGTARVSAVGGAARLSGRASMTAAPDPPQVPLPDGVLVAHKPPNWSSFQVVAKLRNTLQDHFRTYGHAFTGRRKLKVGHGGTLDPMAEGILVIGVGKGCRALEGYLRGSKAYTAMAQLGSETDTQDVEGSVIASAPYAHVTDAALGAAAESLTGEIMQRPPIYSALKRDGKRMYALAREGKVTEEEMEPRAVIVHELRLGALDAAAGTFEMRVRCGGGTYVRSLVVEMGRRVDSAAHMTALCRTRQGPFCLGDAAGAGAPARAVQPVVLAEFADAPRLLEAMAEAAQVLREVEAEDD